MRTATLVILGVLTCSTAFAQTQQVCEEAGGYFKVVGSVCLPASDMDSEQSLLFRSLKDSEQQLAQALLTQQEFTGGSVTARLSNFNARILTLETSRDATDGKPASVYQDQIDRLTAERDRLDSTDPGSPRDQAGNLGPVVSQLNQDISDLGRDLDASIP